MRKVLPLAARLVLGGVFVFSGIEKILSLEDFARVTVNYQILPEKIAVYFAFLLPWLEAALGLLLIAGIRVRQAAFALSALIVIFMAALTIRSTTGPLRDCGCFLSAASGSGHGLAYLLIRDGILLGLGIFLGLGSGDGSLAERRAAPDRPL